MKKIILALVLIIGILLISGCNGPIDGPTITCGDGICSEPAETIDTCPEDCWKTGPGPPIDDNETESEPEPERLLDWCVPDTKWDGRPLWYNEGDTSVWEYTGKVIGETEFRETLVCQIQVKQVGGKITNYYLADENAETCWISSEGWVQNYCFLH